jgi:hypothetical protein
MAAEFFKRAMTVVAATIVLGSGIAMARADDRQPAFCTDDESIAHMKYQYRLVDPRKDPATGESAIKITAVSDIKELGIGSPLKDPGLLAPVPQDLVWISRYCQARIALNTGQEDTVYYRLDLKVQGEDVSTDYDQCSDAHATENDAGCKAFKELH